MPLKWHSEIPRPFIADLGNPRKTLFLDVFWSGSQFSFQEVDFLNCCHTPFFQLRGSFVSLSFIGVIQKNSKAFYSTTENPEEPIFLCFLAQKAIIIPLNWPFSFFAHLSQTTGRLTCGFYFNCSKTAKVVQRFSAVSYIGKPQKTRFFEVFGAKRLYLPPKVAIFEFCTTPQKKRAVRSQKPKKNALFLRLLEPKHEFFQVKVVIFCLHAFPNQKSGYLVSFNAIEAIQQNCKVF